MSIYKVPQDVEADDKLLGPFSFRQFIYLIIVAVAGAAMWGLWGIMPLLAVIPLPVVVFFAALALPLRKDQPMEMYLAAILSFYLKPHKRLWEPDGIDSLIEITAPKEPPRQLTKNLSTSEAEHRLQYLADISDTHGWSIRGAPQQLNTSMNADVFYEAQQAYDPLDGSSTLAQQFTNKISQSDTQRHQQAIARMAQPAAPPASMPLPAPQPQSQPQPRPVAPPLPPRTPAPQPVIPQPAVTPALNPYPQNINQATLNPLSNTPQQQMPQPTTAPPVVPVAPAPVAAPQPPQTTSVEPVAPAIMNLANNSDLSVETIAREAHRIEEAQHDELLGDNEVNISLR